MHCTSQAFDVDNKYGRHALERVYADICGVTSSPMPDVPVRSQIFSLPRISRFAVHQVCLTT